MRNIGQERHKEEPSSPALKEALLLHWYQKCEIEFCPRKRALTWELGQLGLPPCCILSSHRSLVSFIRVCFSAVNSGCPVR